MTKNGSEFISNVIDWLKTRLRYFEDFLTQTYGKDFILQDLDVEDGRFYLRELMEMGTRYEDHPMHKGVNSKSSISMAWESSVLILNLGARRRVFG